MLQLLVVILSQAELLPAQGPARFQPTTTYHPDVSGTPGAAFDDGGWVVAWADNRRFPGTRLTDVWVTTLTDAGILRAFGSPIAPAERQNVQLVSTEAQRVLAWTELVPDAGLSTTGRTSTSTAWPITWGAPGQLSPSAISNTTVLAAGGGRLGLIWVDRSTNNAIISTGMEHPLVGYPNPASPVLTVRSPTEFLSAFVRAGEVVAVRSSNVLQIPRTLTNPTAFRVVASSQEPQLVAQALDGTLSFIIETPGALFELSTLPSSPTQPPVATAFSEGTLVGYERIDGGYVLHLVAAGRSDPPELVSSQPTALRVLTGNPQRSAAILVEQNDAGVTVRPVGLTAGGSVISGSAVVLDLLDAPQQRPTVAWSAEREAFLLLWDEGQRGQTTRYAYLLSDGGLSMAGTLGGEVDGGSRPKLVQGVPMTVVRTENGSTTASRVTEQGNLGLVLPRMTSPTIAFTSRGSRSVLGWGPTGELFLEWRVIPNFAIPAPPPRCAAFRNGVFTLGDLHFGARLDILEDAGITVGQLPIRGLGAGCFATSPSGALVVAYRSDAGIELYDLDARTRLMPAYRGEGEPFVTALGSSMLVTWIDPSGVNGLVVGPQGQVEPVLIDTPRLDARELTVSSAPPGTAAVVWQSFDPSTGRLLVNARLVTRRDGGSADAGAATDGGALDDGGSPHDAGTFTDAGVPDGGPSDAGLPTERDVVTFVPVCGCNTTSAFPVLFIAMVWLARSSRRAGRTSTRNFSVE